MSAAGTASIGFFPKSEAGGGTPAPPFALTSAVNGASVDPVTGKIVLGNDATGLPGAAVLLSDREIALEAFNLAFLGADYHGTRHSITIKDSEIDFVGENDDANGSHIRMLDLNSGLNTDIFNDGASLRLLSDKHVAITGSQIDSSVFLTAHTIVTAFGAFTSILGPESGFQISGTFNAPGTTKTVLLLDLNNVDSDNSSMMIDMKLNGFSALSILIDGSFVAPGFIRFESAIGRAVGKFDTQNLIARIGDTEAAANSTVLQVDDTAQSIDLISGQITVNGTPGFTGTVTPVTSITVVNGIVTAVT